MTLHILDHVFFLAIAVALPIHGHFWLRKRAALIKAGRTELRMALYRTTIRDEWVLALVLAGLWFGLGRGGSELGLGLPGGLVAWAGYALAALICPLLLIQLKSGTPEDLASLRKQFGKLSYLLPHTVAERRTFDAVSVTAGICEELLYRGFGIAYLTSLLGVPFWAAALICSVVFGFAHSYQGPLGVVRTAGVGLALALLYGLTGALWAPIVVHAVMDLTAGRMAHAAFSESDPKGTPTEQAA